MTTALIVAACWLTADAIACTAWALIRGRQKRRVAARQRYTAEALTDARARIARQWTSAPHLPDPTRVMGRP